ncbi:methyltransferase type 12 [Sorangium cellulosum]|uniref:Methyltransferase type 12 n=1 Tax=Sorangium cellulosum TaxID=56 RepID=A0A4P2Q5U1_SORCE|nr:class I SAM-dependent methyltransferase [Sorangium cellulosum]AUX24785.1 methyltransferase type 12 [Sorangium cellulosum]
MSEAEWFAMNRSAWNARTPVHLGSRFYDMPAFRAGASSLKPIELDQVGDVRGKTLLHLQCHFGQDTLSWARLGARVTGLDLSDEAIKAARALAKELSIDARFVEANVYDAPAALGGEAFDIVFTSYGVLGWLPDMGRWARAAASCLKPGGVLHLVEFHPLVWTFDDAFERVAYAYDGHGEPILTEQTGTYTDRDAAVTLKEVGFNHGIGTVVTALLEAGLTLERLREFDWSPYDIFPDMEEGPPGQLRMRKFGRRLPLVMALAARRRA